MRLLKAKGFTQAFVLLLVCLCLVSLLSACGLNGDQADSGRGSEVSVDQTSEKITVFAASSMTDALTIIKEAFEKSHPEVEILLNFAGSKTLRTQIENGAEADVFISANQDHYEALLDQGLIDSGEKLLENSLVVIVSNQSESSISSMDDLTLPVRVVLAQEGVPVGDYARRVLMNYSEYVASKSGQTVESDDYYNKVMANLVSEESNVRQVLMKVALGEADIALVYRTDVIETVQGKVHMIDIDPAYNVTGSYYIAKLPAAKGLSDEFMAFLTGSEGKVVLEKLGFIPAVE